MIDRVTSVHSAKFSATLYQSERDSASRRAGRSVSVRGFQLQQISGRQDGFNVRSRRNNV